MKSNRTSWEDTSDEQQQLLLEGDISCARGSQAKLHPGNQRYRQIIQDHLEEYQLATDKLQKSCLVTRILQLCQEQGDFKRFDNSTKSWYVVTEHIAREKIGQSLRDALPSQYRSSTKAKQQLKKQQLQRKKTTVKHSRKRTSSSHRPPAPFLPLPSENYDTTTTTTYHSVGIIPDTTSAARANNYYYGNHDSQELPVKPWPILEDTTTTATNPPPPYYNTRASSSGGMRPTDDEDDAALEDYFNRTNVQILEQLKKEGHGV